MNTFEFTHIIVALLSGLVSFALLFSLIYYAVRLALSTTRQPK